MAEKEEKKDQKKTNEVVENKDGKAKRVFKAIWYVIKNILDVILNNKFVQILIFLVIFYYFGRSLFKDNKFGVFINGTDNFINNYYEQK